MEELDVQEQAKKQLEELQNDYQSYIKRGVTPKVVENDKRLHSPWDSLNETSVNGFEEGSE